MIALLDTNAYTAIMRADPYILQVVSDARRIVMSAIVVGELEYGFRHGHRYASNRVQLDEWLAESYIDFITLTRDTAIYYGRISSTLRHRGQKIPTNDAWIAAHALEHGAALVTRDAHFEYVDNLDARSW